MLFRILNEDPKDIPVRTSYNNVQFRKVNGQYQVYVENKFVNVTKEQLIATLQFDEKVGIERSAVTTTTETKAPEKYFNPKIGFNLIFNFRLLPTKICSANDSKGTYFSNLNSFA